MTELTVDELEDLVKRQRAELDYWRGLVGANTAAPRGRILTEAMSLINGDRNNQYGPPTQDFERTAGLWNAQGYRGPGERLMMPHDVALMVALLKISRLAWQHTKRDSWVDLAGYAACGYECAVADMQHVSDAEAADGVSVSEERQVSSPSV